MIDIGHIDIKYEDKLYKIVIDDFVCLDIYVFIYAIKYSIYEYNIKKCNGIHKDYDVYFKDKNDCIKFLKEFILPYSFLNSLGSI